MAAELLRRRTRTISPFMSEENENQPPVQTDAPADRPRHPRRRFPRRGNRGPQLTRLKKITEDEPTKYQGLRPFEELTTINPNRKIKLETVPDRYTTRIMDLMTPLGMGQRGLIVAQPRTGKTTLLHHIADAVVKNHP